MVAGAGARRGGFIGVLKSEEERSKAFLSDKFATRALGGICDTRPFLKELVDCEDDGREELPACVVDKLGTICKHAAVERDEESKS
jgi:hypothetical protein